MIGSISSVGQPQDRIARRALGRYVEPSTAVADGANLPAAPKPPEARPDATAELRMTGQPAGTASAPFVAQLAALGFGDALTGERRIRRDPSQVLARADALYRDGYRRITDLEPGFFGAAEY